MGFFNQSPKIPLSGKGLVRKERRSLGKSLRDNCPRASHAVWKVPSNRRDPIDLLIESNRGRLRELIPVRYGRMRRSAFAFYRGAAEIMASDLAETPTSGITVQACGDCHLMNFGAFATPERRIVFDINDFDETLPAPWEWDVKRLATSVVVAGRQNRFKATDAHEAAVRCMQSYREHMQTYAELGVLDLWYDRIEVKALLASLDSEKWGKWKKSVQENIAKASSRTVEEYVFPKLATINNGKVCIKDNPPLIFHQSSLEDIEYRKVITDAFNQYRKTLTDDYNALLNRYQIKDIAVKVTGVGSVGRLCAILLLMTPDDEVLLLQVKEARISVLEPYVGKSLYPNCGQRVVAGQRLMQSASDLFLGWTKGPTKDYYVRQLRDTKIKPHIDEFDPLGMTKYAEWCGWALARAHAKSGDPAIISGYLGKSGEFDEAIARFAQSYADQNERDYKVFLKAIHAGKIEVYNEQ